MPEMQSFTIDINMILTILIGIVAVFEFLGGFRRGVFRQVLHSALVVSAAVVSYYVTEMLVEGLVMGVDQHTINDFLMSLAGSGNPLVSFIPYITFAGWILVLPVATVVAPALFSLIFIVLSIVIKVVYAILSIFVIRVRHDILLKAVGGVLGAAEGVLIVAMVMFPAYSIVYMAEDTVDVLRDKDDGSYTSVIETYDSIADQITENPFFTLMEDMGGKQILEEFFTITIDGEKTNLVHEVDTVVGVVLDVSKMDHDSFVMPDQEHKDMMLAAADSVEGSIYLTTLVVNMFTDLGHAAQDGILPIPVSSSFESLIMSTVGVFASTSRDNIHSDIDTILEVYFMIADSGALKAYDTEGGENQMKDALIAQDEDGNTVISRVVDKLKENKHMNSIVTAISEMTIKLLADSLGVDYDTINAYNEIKNGFNDILAINPDDYTPEEYVEVRDSAIHDVLAEQGVELDKETINELGNFVDENFSDIDELTEENLNDFLLHYFEIIKDEGSVEIPEVE